MNKSKVTNVEGGDYQVFLPEFSRLRSTFPSDLVFEQLNRYTLDSLTRRVESEFKQSAPAPASFCPYTTYGFTHCVRGEVKTRDHMFASLFRRRTNARLPFTCSRRRVRKTHNEHNSQSAYELGA